MAFVDLLLGPFVNQNVGTPAAPVMEAADTQEHSWNRDLLKPNKTEAGWEEEISAAWLQDLPAVPTSPTFSSEVGLQVLGKHVSKYLEQMEAGRDTEFCLRLIRTEHIGQAESLGCG
ncbi:hypothetical protein HJFPF1_07882 [Paramyrothecium foliicola]|nr:hypothetical protein HJFPF1_07882 [Paramyrothecium foliicola]